MNCKVPNSNSPVFSFSGAELEKQKAASADAEDDIREEIKEHEARLAQLENEYALSCEKGKQYSDRLADYENQIADMLESVRELEARYNDIKVRISVLESSHNSDITKGREAREELDRYMAECEILRQKVESSQETVNSYEQRMSETAEKRTEAEKALEAAKKRADEITSLRAEAVLARDSAAEKAKTLFDMEAHFEGYANGVRYVMRRYSEGGVDGAGVIYGPLSKLISARDEYITAAETALANNIQSIVCDNEQTAKAAIRLLKTSGQGRTTFYPLTSVHAQDETEEMRRAYKCRGYIGTASDIIDCDDKFRIVLDSVLGRTLVFDNLDNASECARSVKYRVKLVTLDGQIINAGGSYTGGSSKRDSGIMSRSAKIDQLRAKALELDGQISVYDSELESLSSDINVLSATLASVRQQYDILSTMAGAERAQLEAHRAKLETETELTDKLSADLVRIDEQNSGYAGELASLNEEAEKCIASADEYREKRAALDIEKNTETEEKEKLTQHTNDLLIKLAEARKDKENANLRLGAQLLRSAEIDSDISANLQKAAGYRAALVELERSRELNRENAAQLGLQLDELNRRRSGAEEDGLDYEKKQNELRIRIREKTAEKEVLFKAHTKNEAKVRSLSEQKDKFTAQIWEDYELTYSQAVALGYPEVTEENRTECAASAQKLKNQIRALGSVNVNAIEEYAEIKARYDDMTRQITDLSASRKQLEGIIAKIEGEMKRSFSDAFNKINENFKITFSELFGGGQAELLLTDPENILTSGIDIKAAPPGKIVKSLMLLSGGEQAFVAIALLFAVLRVNPSPFCILDEIEAALDEVNVARFAEYIKKFDSIQFILITHRRGTMEAADRMYGVTMPEQGVSKVIELNVYEFEQRRDEFLK